MTRDSGLHHRSESLLRSSGRHRPMGRSHGSQGRLPDAHTYQSGVPVARVVVDVMLKPEILDPQGQAVANALPRRGVTDVSSVRVGRRIEIEFAGAADLERAREIADKLLANPVIEDFDIRVDESA